MDLDTEFRSLPPEQAAFYAWQGLKLGIVSLSDVSDWVDEVVGRTAAPTSFFIELYKLLRTERPRVAAYLSTAFSAASFTVRPLLGWLHQLVSAAALPLGQILKALYQLRTLATSDQEVGWIYGLAADYERITADPAASLQGLHQETEAFLACYNDYTFANRARWPELDAGLEQRLAGLRH
jgi:hypothetical protein